MKKRISRKTAREVYGVIISGVRSLNTFYLQDDGSVIDDAGIVHYIPPKDTTEATDERSA